MVFILFSLRESFLCPQHTHTSRASKSKPCWRCSTLLLMVMIIQRERKHAHTTSPRSIWSKYVQWPVHVCSCLHGMYPLTTHHLTSAKEQHKIVNPKKHAQLHAHLSADTDANTHQARGQSTVCRQRLRSHTPMSFIEWGSIDAEPRKSRTLQCLFPDSAACTPTTHINCSVCEQIYHPAILSAVPCLTQTE